MLLALESSNAIGLSHNYVKVRSKPGYSDKTHDRSGEYTQGEKIPSAMIIGGE